ncbi:MAG: histidinol-phosphatase HisJ family protein [Clostridia bacterium]|nr:histidinol-phosphatase HisJ family protein [Clostridia bacterium]
MHKERIIDMHVHSDNSPDGIHSPMFICEQAVDKGLRAIAFTDHCEIDTYHSQKYDCMAFHSYFECSKARVAFEGQLLVLIGLEIGQPNSDYELTKKIVNSRPYDVILGSIHTPKGFNCDIKEIEYDKIDVYDFMKNYFAELTEMAYCPEIDILAHITCPMRRIQGKYGIAFDYEKIQKETDELLKAIIKNDKVLEINTSGLRQPIGKTMPDENIIRRYKELGGKHISIGSDSHSAYDTGAGIREGMLLAKRCGFDRLTFLVDREIMEIENNI